MSSKALHRVKFVRLVAKAISIFATVIEDLDIKRDSDYELFFAVQGRYAVAAGVIYKNFPSRVQELRDNHPNVDTIILYNVPGGANDARMIEGAKMIHEAGYQTCVPSIGVVGSGGTENFVAGTKRYTTPGASIGIHSWGGGGVDGSELPRDHPSHNRYLNLYDDICIPQEFYWETLSHGLPLYYVKENEIDTTFPYFRDCTAPCQAETEQPGVDQPGTEQSGPSSSGTTVHGDISGMLAVFGMVASAFRSLVKVNKMLM